MVKVTQGDLIWIDAEPHAGREEGGHNPQRGNIRRPMIVLSTAAYYDQTGLIIGMPITHRKFKRTDILIPINDQTSGIDGSIITYQMPNYDFAGRHGKVAGHMGRELINQLLPIAVGVYGITL